MKTFANWFRNLFVKKEELVKVEEEVKEEEKKEEETPIPVAIPSEPEKKEEIVEEALVEEAPTITFKEFSDEDKQTVVDMIRPLVKKFNSDDLYTSICEKMEAFKTLKTFSSLSEDRKTLTIKFTQNELFNKDIAEFVVKSVKDIEEEMTNAGILGKYLISSENGEINIKKIG